MQLSEGTPIVIHGSFEVRFHVKNQMTNAN
jgi:hypothetical protein